MTTEAQKSASIVNLDSSPIVFNPAGEGGPGMMRAVNDQVVTTTGATAPSTYRLVRVPIEANIKHVWIWLDGSVSTLTADIDISFSDSTTDGTNTANQGTIPQIASADNKLYGAAVDLHAVVAPTDYVVNAGGASLNKAVWQNLGLTSSPGGYVDIMLKTTATNSGAATVNCQVQYVV